MKALRTCIIPFSLSHSLARSFHDPNRYSVFWSQWIEAAFSARNSSYLVFVWFGLRFVLAILSYACIEKLLPQHVGILARSIVTVESELIAVTLKAAVAAVAPSPIAMDWNSHNNNNIGNGLVRSYENMCICLTLFPVYWILHWLVISISKSETSTAWMWVGNGRGSIKTDFISRFNAEMFSAIVTNTLSLSLISGISIVCGLTIAYRNN